MQSHASSSHGHGTGRLPGGSTAVTCCLCPVRHGAFKKTAETREWCHVVGVSSWEGWKGVGKGSRKIMCTQMTVWGIRLETNAWAGGEE